MLAGATLNTRDNAKFSLFRPQCYDLEDSGGSVSGRANLACQFTDELFGYAELRPRLQVRRTQHVGLCR